MNEKDICPNCLKLSGDTEDCFICDDWRIHAYQDLTKGELTKKQKRWMELGLE